MRLIDADNLKGNIIGNNSDDLAAVLKRWIDNQPTVSAIPAEWLEKRRDILSVRATLRMYQNEQEAEDETD